MLMGDRHDGRRKASSPPHLAKPKKHPKAMPVPHSLARSRVVAVRSIPALSMGRTRSHAAPQLHESQHPGSHKELALKNQLINLLKQW